MSTQGARKRTNRKICILSCSGASNLGQVANQAALELVEEGFGEGICTAAVGARVKWAVERLRDAGKIVAINGCDSECARKILKDIGRDDAVHVTTSELGIDKSPGFFMHTYEVEKVKEAVRRAVVEA